MLEQASPPIKEETDGDEFTKVNGIERTAELPRWQSSPGPAENEGGKETPSFGPGGCLKLYLHEIGKVKLLTPEQEIELAQRIRKGDEEAREHMIKANLRLVVKIARDF
jgi:DNA-directed RNA polymerase sigma subunit (sigma70/sigma32)